MNVHPFHEVYASPALRESWLKKKTRSTHKQMLVTENMVLRRGGILSNGVRATVLRECLPPIIP